LPVPSGIAFLPADQILAIVSTLRLVKVEPPEPFEAKAWEAARKQLLVKEKAQTRARDALAAERRPRLLNDP
jgi:hypothetical protein